MERTTFLGLGPPAKDPRPPPLLEEHGASCADAAIYLPTSGILRPVPSKLPTLHHHHQQFMSFKPVHEDGLTKKVHGDVRNTAGFQSVVPMGGGPPDASNHRAPAQLPQKNYNKAVQGNAFSSFLNLTNKHSFPLPSHPSRGASSSSPQVNNSNVHLTSYPYGLVPAKSHGFVSSGPQSPFAGHYPHHATTMQQQQHHHHQQQQGRVVGAAGHEAPVTCQANLGYNTRNSSQPLPTHGQLTIFFGGMVNVYENVSLEKVQAIMSMAANGSSITPEISNASKQVPLVHPGTRVKPVDCARVKPSSEAIVVRHPPQTEPMMIPHPSQANEAMMIRHPPQTNEAMMMRHHPSQANEAMMIRHPSQTNVASPYSGLCSPTSVASASVDHSASSSNSPDEPKGSKSPAPSASKVSAEDGSTTQTTPMSKAVPMARKASLARFLEKRKERISHLAPYPASQKLSDGSLGIKAICSFSENHTAKSNSASVGAKDQPWHPGRASTGLDPNFVNTELGI